MSVWATPDREILNMSGPELPISEAGKKNKKQTLKMVPLLVEDVFQKLVCMRGSSF